MPRKKNKTPTLKSTPELYRLSSIRNKWEIWTPQTVTAEYTKLAKIANRRLEVMAKYEIGRESQTYKMNVGRYVPADKLTLGEQKVLLADLARMLTSETGSYTGVMRKRRETIKTLHEHGYTFVTQKNLTQFGQFMEDWRSREGHQVGSPGIAEMFFMAQREKVDTDGLANLFENYVEQARQASTPESLQVFGRRINSEEFRQEFLSWLQDQ